MRPPVRVSQAPGATLRRKRRPRLPAPSSDLDAVVVAEVPARRVTPEDIQVRAYFLAMENGGNGGSLDFWLRAERELLTGAGADD